MTAATYNFTVRQGNTDRRTFVMLDDQSPAEPIDLTGSTMIFRAVYPLGAGVLKKSSADGDLTVRATDGEVDLVLTAAETRAFPAGRTVRYELERRINGDEETLLSGYITVTEGLNDDA